MSVGGPAAYRNGLVQLVVRGLAKACSFEKIEAGDPVTPAMNKAILSGHPVAQVRKAASPEEPVVGRCLTGATGSGQEVVVLVDVSGPGAAEAEPQVRWLGVLNAGERFVRPGIYEPGSESARRRAYAKFYAFSVAYPTRVQLDLSSAQDTYLYLYEGNGTDGTLLEQDDDDGPGYDSRITRDLQPGVYTIEASTYRRATGSFILTLQGHVPSPGGFTASPGLAPGTAVLDWYAPPNAPQGTDYKAAYWETAADESREEETFSFPPVVVYGLRPWVSYTFRLRMSSPVSWRDTDLISAPLFAETAVPLTPPANFMAARVSRPGALRLDWDHPPGFNPGIHHYEIQARTVTVDNSTGMPIDTEWLPAVPIRTVNEALLLTGLETEIYEVRAVSVYEDEDGNRRESGYAYATGTPAAMHICPPPGNLQAAASGPSSLSVTWDLPESFNPGTDRSKFQYRTTLEDPKTGEAEWTEWMPSPPVTVGGEDHSLTSLAPGVYGVRVWTVCYGADGNPEGSSRPAYAQGALGAPASVECNAPVNLAVTAEVGGLTASWDTPEGFDAATHEYEYQYRSTFEDPETGDVEWDPWTPETPESVSANSFSLLDLHSVEHQVRVRTVCKNSGGKAIGASGWVAGRGAPLPRPVTAECESPGNLEVRPTRQPGELLVTWEHPKNFGPETHSYHLQYRVLFDDPELADSYFSVWTPQPPITVQGTGYKLTGLTAAFHHISVRTVCRRKDEVADFSNPPAISGGTPFSPGPRTYTAPNNLQVNAMTLPGQLSVTWDRPAGFDPATDSYELQYRASKEDPETGDRRPGMV